MPKDEPFKPDEEQLRKTAGKVNAWLSSIFSLFRRQKIEVETEVKGGGMTGQGRAAAEARALRDAERRKGGPLTEEESGYVKKLSGLTWDLSGRHDLQSGDLSIQANSLTACGGFQTGAAVPDSEKYNKMNAENGKAMLSVVQRIETICRQFGTF